MTEVKLHTSHTCISAKAKPSYAHSTRGIQHESTPCTHKQGIVPHEKGEFSKQTPSHGVRNAHRDNDSRCDANAHLNLREALIQSTCFVTSKRRNMRSRASGSSSKGVWWDWQHTKPTEGNSRCYFTRVIMYCHPETAGCMTHVSVRSRVRMYYNS